MTDIEILYSRLSEVIDRVDFNALWRGFHRFEFALYNSSVVVLNGRVFEKDDRFFGNTAISFEGRYIAIWNADNDYFGENLDLESMASYIIHEMFHAYQYEKGESRFPDDRETMLYPVSPAAALNFTLRIRENRLLSRLALEDDLSVKYEMFRELVSLRKQRAKLIGDFIKLEYNTETSEGMADFCGTLSLSTLSLEKYAARIEHYAKLLGDMSPLQFDIRNSCYYSGVLLLTALRDLSVDITHDISSEKSSVFDLAAEHFTPIEITLPVPDPEVTEKLRELKLSKDEQIDAFLSEECDVFELLDGDFYISGYDPMNMFRSDDRILCKTFISLTDSANGETRRYFGMTLLEALPGSPSTIRRYYRKKEGANE